MDNVFGGSRSTRTHKGSVHQSAAPTLTSLSYFLAKMTWVSRRASKISATDASCDQMWNMVTSFTTLCYAQARKHNDVILLETWMCLGCEMCLATHYSFTRYMSSGFSGWPSGELAWHKDPRKTEIAEIIILKSLEQHLPSTNNVIQP